MCNCHSIGGFVEVLTRIYPNLISVGGRLKVTPYPSGNYLLQVRILWEFSNGADKSLLLSSGFDGTLIVWKIDSNFQLEKSNTYVLKQEELKASKRYTDWKIT